LCFKKVHKKLHFGSFVVSHFYVLNKYMFYNPFGVPASRSTDFNLSLMGSSWLDFLRPHALAAANPYLEGDYLNQKQRFTLNVISRQVEAPT